MYLSYNKIRFKTILLGLAFMLLGSAPILYYFFKTGFFTNFAMKSIIVSRNEVHNLNIFGNLFTRFRHLSYVIEGSYYNCRGLKYGYNFGVLFSATFFWSCVLYLSYLIFIKRKTLFTRWRILFILSVSLLTFIMSTVTFTAHRPGHLFILFPYIQIIMGISLFEMGKHLGDRFKSWKMVIILLVLMLVIVNTKVSLLRHKKLIVEKIHNPVYEYDISTRDISMLTSWLWDSSKLLSWLLENKNKYYRPVIFNLDDGIRLNFYSGGEIDFINLPLYNVYDRNPSFNSMLEGFISNTKFKLIYIFDFSDSLFFLNHDLEAYKIFRQLVKKLNKRIIIRKKFLYPDGRIRYLVVSLK